MPEPKEGESQKEFVSKCIPIVLEDGTAKDQNQAVAVCNSMWEKAQEGKAANFQCECLKCGHTMASQGHCADIKCPECGGEMRRAERPGPGKAVADDVIERWEKRAGEMSEEFLAWVKQKPPKPTPSAESQNNDEPIPSYAVKFVRDEDDGAVVGGYIALWGSPETKDLQGDYFTPETWLGLDEYPSVPALFHHGLDEKVGLSVIGRRVKSGVDDTGAWVEDWLDKSNQYWKMVRPLLDKEALFYSPGSAPHLVKREDDGRLDSYPIVEDTFTVIPAQHRLRPVEQIKAAYKAAGLDYPLEDGETGGDESGDSCPEADEAAAKAIELLARINELTTED